MKPQRAAGSSKTLSKASMQTPATARKSRAAVWPVRVQPQEDRRGAVVGNGAHDRDAARDRNAARDHDEARGCTDGRELDDWLQADVQAEAGITRRFGSHARAGHARH